MWRSLLLVINTFYIGEIQQTVAGIGICLHDEELFRGKVKYDVMPRSHTILKDFLKVSSIMLCGKACGIHKILTGNGRIVLYAVFAQWLPVLGISSDESIETTADNAAVIIHFLIIRCGRRTGGRIRKIYEQL